MCGEAVYEVASATRAQGPSPRVRGSPVSGVALRAMLGSIPACAGKPGFGCGAARDAGVHPRVCGEAAATGDIVDADEGPSPRVRGSPDRRHGSEASVGSIPACAGKPGRP